MAFERLFILAAMALSALAPLVLRDEYLLHLGILILFSITLATSFNLIVGYIGEFPLGHTAFLGIGAYAAALLSTRLGLPMFLTLGLGGILSAAAGLLIGAITLRLRGPFFVIVTLCFAEVLRLIANNWVGLTNGPMGIAGVPKPSWIEGQSMTGQKASFYYVAWAIAAAGLYVAYRYVHSNLGRGAVAVRENRFVAQSVGIKPYRQALLTFVIAALLCGCAGAFYAHYISFVGPEVFGFPFMISMIIMVLLGGKGTLVGPIVGPIIVVLLEEYLRDLKDLRFSIFGIVVMAIVIFLPAGLMGFVARQREVYAKA
jgi:branched-chain amino acid transport system permease protein